MEGLPAWIELRMLPRYSEPMELPLKLIRHKDGGLHYAIPLWYRLLMAFIVAVVAGSMLIANVAAGPVAWILMVVVILAGLYEERWIFDPESRTIRNRTGLLVAARSLEIPFDEVELFRLVPHVRGTIPGSADEREQNEAALKASRGDDSSRRRQIYKRPYVGLILDRSDGSHYLIDSMNARRSPVLRQDAARMAACCGKTLLEGYDS